MDLVAAVSGHFDVPMDDVKRLQWLIDQLIVIEPARWQTDTVRGRDATGQETNCFFGHVFNLGGGDTPAPTGRGNTGSQLWDWFDERWATTYMIFPVNDGTNPAYPQATPSARILVYLADLRDGRQFSTDELMERDYQFYLAEEAEKAAQLEAIDTPPDA